MAKKSPAKPTRKPAKTAAAAPRPPRRVPGPGKKTASAQAKYQQSGAPWWKQFLPK